MAIIEIIENNSNYNLKINSTVIFSLIKYVILREFKFGRISRCLENHSGPPIRSEKGTHYLHSVSQARFRERKTQKTRDPIVTDVAIVVAVVPKFPRAG